MATFNTKVKDFSFTAILTLPEGIEIPSGLSTADVALDGFNGKFKVRSVGVSGQTVTVVMDLNPNNEAYTNLKLISDAVMGAGNQDGNMSVTIDNLKVTKLFSSTDYAVANATVDANFHAAVVNGPNGSHFDFMWHSVQTDNGKDVHADDLYTENGTDSHTLYSTIVGPEVKTENESVTRIIKVVKPDGTVDTTTQTADFELKYYMKDGEKVYTDDTETEKTLDAFTTPEIEGYTPSMASVDALTVTPESDDSEVTITYTKNEVPATPETPATETTTPEKPETPTTTPTKTSVKPTADKTATPKTGDAALAVGGVAASGLLALMGGLFARRKQN